MVEITDKDSARAWLETQPKQVCVTLAARAALRQLAGLGTTSDAEPDGLALSCLRAVLSAASMGLSESKDTKESSHLLKAASKAAYVAEEYGKNISQNNSSALGTIRSVTEFLRFKESSETSKGRGLNKDANESKFSVTENASGDVEFHYLENEIDALAVNANVAGAALSASFAALAAASSNQRAALAASLALGSASPWSLKEFSKDAAHAQRGEPVEQIILKPIFQNSGELEESKQARAALLRFLDAEPAKWDFWARWYRGMFDGQPMDWALQRAVALIPDDVWEAGPDAVAERIAEIEAEFKAQEADRLAEALPLAETIEFNTETGKFRHIVDQIANPPLLAASLSQVSDALDDVLANPSNGLNAQSRETLVLRRTALKYGNDPQRVEMDFVSVHAGLTRQIISEDLPPSEANLALQSALEEGARGIRATHPDIAENRRILNAQALAELTPEQKRQVAAASPVLEAISEPDLAEGWAEDIAEIVGRQTRPVEITREFGAAQRNPVLATYAAEARVFSRAAQIGVLLRKTPELIHRIDGSAGYKGARIVATIAALVSLGIVLIG